MSANSFDGDQRTVVFEPEGQRDEKAKQALIIRWEAELVASLEEEVLDGQRNMGDIHPHLTTPRVHSPARLALIAAMDAHEVWGDSISQTGQALIEEDPGLSKLGPEETAA